MPESPDVDATVRKIEALVDAHPEAGELVQLLMQLYGAGLSRVVEVIRVEGQPDLVEQLAGDKLVASLLLLHGLHPIPAETRLQRALQRLERRLESQRVLLVQLRDGVAHIRVEHQGAGDPSAGLADMIERAAMEAAPELEGVQIEGAALSASLVQIAPARSAG
jgi:CII-binding regulator of phage lambda lysogenization HflD